MSLHHLHMATSLASLNPSCFQQCFATHQPRKHIVSNQKKQIHVTNLHMSSKKSIYFGELLKTSIFPTHFHPIPPVNSPFPPRRLLPRRWKHRLHEEHRLLRQLHRRGRRRRRRQLHLAVLRGACNGWHGGSGLQGRNSLESTMVWMSGS